MKKTETITRQAIKEARDIIGDKLNAKQLGKLENVISQLAVEVAKDVAKECRKQAVKAVGPKTDLAANIAEGIKRSKVALVSNLQSMR